MYTPYFDHAALPTCPVRRLNFQELRVPDRREIARVFHLVLKVDVVRLFNPRLSAAGTDLDDSNTDSLCL